MRAKQDDLVGKEENDVSGHNEEEYMGDCFGRKLSEFRLVKKIHSA